MSTPSHRLNVLVVRVWEEELFWGLCHLLTGLTDFDEMLQLSEKGDNTKYVEISHVRDIFAVSNCCVKGSIC